MFVDDPNDGRASINGYIF